jgi:hypothetical protein
VGQEIQREGDMAGFHHRATGRSTQRGGNFCFPPQPCHVLIDLSTNARQVDKECFSTAIPTMA